MEIISDDRLIETLKLLLNSRNGSMTLNELQRDFEELEGKHVPELKFLSLLKNNSIFHVIRPINGSEERFDIRYDVKAKLNRTQYTPPKKFNPQTMTAITTPRSMKNTTDRSKYSLVNYHNIINTNNNNNNSNSNNNNNLNNNNNQTKNNNPIVELPQKQPSVDLRHKINNRKDIPTAPPKLMMPLSERLKRKGELSPSDILAAESVIIPDKVWDNITLSFYSKLLQYCKDNKLSPPELKFLNNPLAKNTFRCQVTVKDKTYMAYNDSFDTESEAREACCKVAINEINREEELAKYPLDVANDFEIVKKIYGMIKGSIGGVFCKHISALYTDTHQLSIPEHWLQVVKQYDQKLFNFELSLQQDDILFATGDIDSFIDRPTSAASSIESIETPKQMVPELVFPWSSKLWNVFVTNAYNTNEVCVRLIGESYSDALDDLLNDIDLKMMVDKERPTEIKRNIIYLTSIAECWHRIRVIEKNDNQANCICIDNGDFEWINFDEIYICRPEFLTIAPQAFKISMFGLEDFESHPNISVQLFEPLIFKSLVAEVMITESTFQVKNPISMILYDTSSDEDVNLNETLMSNILSSIPAPTLSAKDNNQITVTHIGDDVIYCQLLTSSNYIQQLINKLPKSDIEKHSGLCVDKTDKKKIYLIYDSKLKNWYRGRMERLMDGDDHVFYYIDQGFKATVNVKDVYRLDKMNVALSLYPQQVIKFSLFSVQLTDNVKKRLLALLPAGRQALVKVVNVANNLPQVQLFTHITHNNETIMIKINDQFPFNNGTKASDEDEKPIKVDQRILKNNGEFIKVTVTLVLSPQCFGIQLQDDLVAFQTMMNDLQSFCKSNTKMVPFNMVEKGESYAVYVDDEDKWYRASAENIIDDNFIHFYLFDYGHFKMNSLKSLRQLPNIFRNLPKQAMKAKLFGVKPKNKDFTPEDAIYFKELTENKSFPAVIKNISRDMFSDEDIYEVVLFGETRKIHELLIEEKRVLSA